MTQNKEDFKDDVSVSPKPQALEIAVILPCYNEAVAIGETVAQFRDALPNATIYVFDNNSTDESIRVAQEAGAVVRSEPLQGKGNVVRRMFADVDADVYIMADGDATYDSAAAPELVNLLVSQNLDMVNGARVNKETEAYRPGHKFGNALFTGLVKFFFSSKINDLLSGYRVFSRRFVKSFPAVSDGFEIETELTVHAMQMRMPIGEVKTSYFSRLPDSDSKLSTFRDGWRILKMISLLIKEEKPMAFFLSLALIVFVPSLLMFFSVLGEFLETGIVTRMPSLVVAVSGFVAAMLSVVCALILDSLARGRREIRRLSYLQYPGFARVIDPEG
ncbi:glycosyltransferase [Rhodobacteraceae bacterium B1Z28]|uniref:Glycosyltransferase n=2 Tax=Ruegeria haliotis TaxID=2747601 RepID=A0ABX2PS28_9RHOB|nr:glycosyltransferase [Ruegeria haliotis]